MQFKSLFHQAFPAFWLPKYVNIGSLILSQSVGLCKTTVYVLELYLYLRFGVEILIFIIIVTLYDNTILITLLILNNYDY